MWWIQSRFQQSCISIIDQRLNANGILTTLPLTVLGGEEKRLDDDLVMNTSLFVVLL